MPTYPPTTQPLTPTSPVTSSLHPPIAVPTHGSGGTFTVLAKTKIGAPPAVVLSCVRNTSTWKVWNSFCPSCTISSSRSGGADGDGDGDGEGEMPFGREGWLDLGTEAVIDVFMNGDGLVDGKRTSRVQGIEVTVLEKLEEEGQARRTGFKIAWKSTGWAYWQLHSERVMDFVLAEDGGTEYVCWETFGGLLASVVKRTVGGQLVDRFGDYARDVKGFAESGGGQ